MKLYEFNKVSAGVYTYYCIKDGDKDIDSFTVDYRESNPNIFYKSILKRKMYDKAIVINVSDLYPDHGLYVVATIRIDGFPVTI